MHTVLIKLLYIAQSSLSNLLILLPYLVFGVILGEFLKLTSWTKLIYKGVSKSLFTSILIAALLGMVSPLCTYGTVPVVLQLFYSGINIAPLATFLATSSMMNPQLFIITLGGLGTEMAIARALAILIFGLGFGFIVNHLPLSWVVNSNIKQDMSLNDEILKRSKKIFDLKTFINGIYKNLEFVGFYMILGIILGETIKVCVPSYMIDITFQKGSWLSVFLAAIMGVPLYACGGGTVPFIQSLIQKGMSKGSALAFFLVGSATRPAPLVALAALLNPFFIAAYVVILIAFSMIIGVLYH
jgi:uncharacterized protein